MTQESIAAAAETRGPLTTNIPQRMDRLPWSRWHWLIVSALGVTWILDGLEVTIVGALGAVLTHPGTLGLTESEVGLTASAYLAGSVLGAVVFSYLTDQQGRKRWFMITLLLYLSATVLTALSWDLWSFMLFRFLAGAGIGGEYAAINSAIDELIPARARGHTDLAINGSWWMGTAAGALLTIPLLNPNLIAESIGWRLCFALGAILGVAIILIRRVVPESPRWLMTHGMVDEAEAIVRQIEDGVKREQGLDRLPEPRGSITVHPRTKTMLSTVARELFRTYPRRTVLGMTLMVTQSFLYNAIFFTYALVLTKFYGVPTNAIGFYILPFAVGNFFGPLLLGRFFDTIGRKPMIALTYGLSGVLLAVTAFLLASGALTAVTQTIAWCFIFFFASAGASSAYLTVSEVFPLEIRAMAIAFFFVVGQGAGVLAPWLFGLLIQTSAAGVVYGYLVGAGFMIAGAVVALVFGVKAERQSLEDIAAPLSAR
jgi:MFS family permease